MALPCWKYGTENANFISGGSYKPRAEPRGNRLTTPASMKTCSVVSAMVVPIEPATAKMPSLCDSFCAASMAFLVS